MAHSPAARRARGDGRLRWASWLTCIMLTLASGCHWRSGRDPDVILVVVDTLRAENMSLYGYTRETTPKLREFARDAVNFVDAISPGTWTIPSHGSLFTGRWPSYHGAERVPGETTLAMPLNPEVPTLAEMLRMRGWSTAAIVANSTYVSPLFGFDRGFEKFADNFGFVRASKILGVGASWLAQQKGKAFLFLNVFDPHEPYEPPPPFDTLFPGKQPAFGTMLTKLVYDDHLPVTEEMRAHFISQYDGEVAFTDQSLGRFFDRLRKLGRYDSSLIIVTSDHGEMLGEHGLAGHGVEPFEPLLHVPLLVKYPAGRSAGSVVGERVSTLGVFATILATLRIPPPEGNQSMPLDDRPPVFVEDLTSAGQRVEVGYEGSEKLVAAGPPGQQAWTWLYDLKDDPNEEHPIHGGTGADRLRATLTAFGNASRPVSTAQRPVIDPEREAKLRALGYVR